MHLIQEDHYSYFLMEAQELLQSIEQELLSLREGRTPAKVHGLMRAAHTLKGAAASVGMEMMKNVAHVMEDVFKSLYNPEVVIDAELESLLFQGYECLRLCLQAPKNSQSSEEALADQAATIIAELQIKLGDFLNQETSLPSSIELGFDVVQSIFEMGVKQRLDALEQALTDSEPTAIAANLEADAEIFLGLAESLSLPGWGEIASAILAALAAHPDRVMEIAEVALADLKQAHSAVLAGDRTSGGTPSLSLQQLAEIALDDDNQPETATDFVASSLDFPESLATLYPSLENLFENFATEPELVAEATQLQAEAAEENTTLIPALSLSQQQENREQLPFPEEKRLKTTVQQSVRVEVEQLEHLNYLAGELVVNQNKQSAEIERLRKLVRELLNQSQRHHQTMDELRDWAFQMRRGKKQWSGVNSQELTYLPISPVQFDSLEMDFYNELDVLLQAALEETATLETTAEGIDSCAKQSGLTLEKQQRLLRNVRDDLLEARMQPVGDVLNRFQRVLHQLAFAHNKPVELIITGADVLVDKAVVEKLYDPILHLVRNAFAHGIEPTAVRQARGKPVAGQIELRAYHQGNRTMIEVRDDGEGLNFQSICQRALEVNLLTPEQASSVSEQQLIDLLFEPGFSTASKLTELSGRGVGLDVVLSQLQMLGGSVAIKSQPQQGTSFSLQIPLSLNITKLMLCQADGITYALAVEGVEQVVLPQPQEVQSVSGQRILHRRIGQTKSTIVIRKLSDLVTYSQRVSQLSVFSRKLAPFNQLTAEINQGRTEQIQQSPILLLRHGTQLYGLEVDQIFGEQELVIRPLGKAIVAPKYVYGASILSNSRIALALDIALLVNQFIEAGSLQQTGKQDPTLQARTNLVHVALPASKEIPTRELPTKLTLPKVLIVDDSVTIRQTLASTLVKAGYQVLQATDGVEALEQLQQNKGTQLEVICDVEMPRMNGFEFLNHCRQHPLLSQIPVVMLTSRNSDKYRQIALQLGAAGYLTKPYSEQELLTTLSNLSNVLH